MSQKIVEVVVGVLIREDGKMLLSSRPEGKPYAGYWEFPGGKIEAAETAEAALARELEEELGVLVKRSTPWFVMEHRYEHAHVRLHFRRSHDFTGEPTPKEGQQYGFFSAAERTPGLLLPVDLAVVNRVELPEVFEESVNQRTLSRLALQAAVVRDRRGLTLLVRNALFARVRLAAHAAADELGKLDVEWGWRAPAWQHALDRFHEAHDEILLDADARSAAYLSIDESDERSTHVWHVHQVFRDSDDDRDFGIWGDVDLDATQDEGAVVFSSYRVGFVDDE